MPIKYVGKITTYAGKPLEEILMKLNNFGVGRMVYRNKFERYPEASYYRITQVGAVEERSPRNYNAKSKLVRTSIVFIICTWYIILRGQLVLSVP